MKMAPTPEQARIIEKLKSGPPLKASIPIRSVENLIVGYLTPITRQMAENPDIIDALYRWRRARMTAFLTVFVPTPEKTRHYLTEFSLPDAARVLFLITDHDGRHVGHIGLCNIASDGVEIDNLSRGESIDVPGIMVRAHAALLRWAFSSLDIPLAYLNVLADNAQAIRTYEKAGLRAVGTTPLTREEFDGGYRLKPALESDTGKMGLTLVRMEILQDVFFATEHEAGSAALLSCT